MNNLPYCEMCGGSGGGEDPATQCTRCNGTGVDNPEIDLADEEESDPLKCLTCNASGWLKSEDYPFLPCPDCDGTGRADFESDPF